MFFPNDPELIKRLVDEGRRIGKCPWCCDGFYEYRARSILETYFYIYGQETMDETCARRDAEKPPLNNKQ